ncbi:GDP-mannose 4,6 dehydratase [Myotis brandtii]|uniref:GDP-mannose 4,6-dehydratase n=1 Tax=Myotis brandtii TaxID=109478 RepID=S7PN47_MYOBR|nr:GDP-mannose 4,6 dehydratase [Myotis brandtii]
MMKWYPCAAKELIENRIFRWEGKNENEVGRCKETGKVHVTVDLKYYRPTEVDFLQGDCTKAKQKLNWKPRVAFDELVREMVDADVELMRNNPNA